VTLTSTLQDFVAKPTTLKRRAYRAVGVTIIGYAGSVFLRLAASIVVTRLLSPDLYGILAVITAIQLLIALLTDFGIRASLLRSPNSDNPQFQDTAWTLQVLRGILMFGVGLVVSGALYLSRLLELTPVDSAYGDPQLPVLISVSLLSSVILSCQSINYVLANRALNLERITAIDLISQAASLCLIGALAWMTRSIWSYVIGSLFTSFLIVLLSHVWLEGRIARFGWYKDAAVELSHFGKWVFLSSLISAFAISGDRLLLAALITPAALGNFNIATNIVAVPDAVTQRVFGNIALPALSEVWREQPHRLAEIYWRMRKIIDAGLVGFAGVLFAVGPSIISILYDSRYSTAGSMIQLLSFSLILSRFGIAPSLYLALGFSKYVTVLSIAKLFSLFSIVPLLYWFFGVPGAVFGVAVYMLPATVCIFIFNQRFGLNRVRTELALLTCWPIGWSIGVLASYLISIR
jgi:O-antigen/teichoic acid export membrane protein